MRSAKRLFNTANARNNDSLREKVVYSGDGFNVNRDFLCHELRCRRISFGWSWNVLHDVSTAATAVAHAWAIYG
jgi:hypothetical protein